MQSVTRQYSGQVTDEREVRAEELEDAREGRRIPFGRHIKQSEHADAAFVLQINDEQREEYSGDTNRATPVCKLHIGRDEAHGVTEQNVDKGRERDDPHEDVVDEDEGAGLDLVVEREEIPGDEVEENVEEAGVREYRQIDAPYVQLLQHVVRRHAGRSYQRTIPPEQRRHHPERQA